MDQLENTWLKVCKWPTSKHRSLNFWDRDILARIILGVKNSQL